MGWSFTPHFQALNPGCEDAAGAEAVRADLRRAVEVELRRRGLWGAPPAYVGALGHARWDREAIDELAGECYLYQLARLRGLKPQLQAGADIDGFVLLNVRHFLFERQRGHDPLGYRVFEMLERAVARGLADGHLRLANPDERVRNDTIVYLGGPGSDLPLAAAESLAPLAREWNDGLLPALVTAQGRPQREAVGARLAGHLARLPEQGVRAFRFGDLLEPLKRDVRARWAALVEQTEDTTALQTDEDLVSIVRAVAPDTSFEEREHFEKLLESAARHCADLPAERGPGELLSLLSVLARHASNPESEGRPSDRTMARETGIPRHRLGVAYARLREVLAECSRAIATPRAVSDSTGPASSR